MNEIKTATPHSEHNNAHPAVYIKEIFDYLFEPNQVIEIRAIVRKNRTLSGYFNDFGKAALAALSVRNLAPNSYVTLNTVNPILLARAANRIKDYVDQTTSDDDILIRTFLPIDLDVVRPAGISSTDIEHQAAIIRTQECLAWLKDLGFPDIIFADSGNGGHLLPKIDIPITDKTRDESRDLIQKCLEALHQKFSDNKIKIDLTCFNAARIWKVYGTTAGKGDELPDRTHRMAKIISKPEILETVSWELLEKLASFAIDKPKKTSSKKNQKTTFDVADWIKKHNLNVREPESWGKGGTKWIFDVCPWNPDHTNGSAGIFQLPDGAISAKCHHDGCTSAGNDWHKLRDLIEPDWRDHGVNLNPDLIGRLDDIGNGERFVAQHGGACKWSDDLGWLVWNDKYWTNNSGHEVQRRAEKTARNILVEAQDTKGGTDRFNDILKWAGLSASMGRINAMLESAKNKPGMSLVAGDFDKDPWLLNLRNGTLDLKTFTLRPHDRDSLITKFSDIEYNPAAHCPTWNAYLNLFIPNLETRHFLQKCAGYSLTGSTVEQCFFLLYGMGKNGKSTFIMTLARCLGSLADVMSTDALMIKKNSNGVALEIANLLGLRMAYSVEPPATATLNTSFIKQQTGGEKLQGKFHYKNLFSFLPTHKLWVSANHDINIPEGDEGIKRRLKQVPFAVTIPESDRDPDFFEKFLVPELPGILNFFVDGCRFWQEEGLGDAPEVRAATSALFARLNPIREFIDEATEPMPRGAIRTSVLHKNYLNWAKEVGDHHPLKRRRFREVMIENGYSLSTLDGYESWNNIAIKLPKSPDPWDSD